MTLFSISRSASLCCLCLCLVSVDVASQEVPRSGVLVYQPPGFPDFTCHITQYEGRPMGSLVSNETGPQGNTGSAPRSVVDKQSLAESYTFAWEARVDIQAFTQISGYAEATVSAGPATADALVHARSMVKYCNQKVESEGGEGAFVTSKGGLQGVGTGVTLGAFGWQYSGTWTVWTGGLQRRDLSGLDIGLPECSKTAVAILQADGAYTLWIDKKGGAEASYHAEAGALILVSQNCPDGENNMLSGG